MLARPLGAILACSLTALAVTATPAKADAIDGEWCSKDGKHISIRGSNITTPAGTQTTGQYDRHAFNYTVPASDPGAGTNVFMTLINDQTVHLIDGSQSDMPVETWLRCEVTS